MILSRLKQAREKVELLRLALLDPSPEQIFLAIPGLQQAEASLTSLEAELRDGQVAERAEIRHQLKRLKNDLRLCARLLCHGIAFCRGWANLNKPGSSYTPTGASAELAPEASLEVHG